MDYHYETQPIPSPISWLMHHNPPIFHKFETLTNHVAECMLPILVIIPLRQCRLLGGFCQVLFQFLIIVSGNLAFLNWLTIAPAIWCFDDRFLSCLFSNKTLNKLIPRLKGCRGAWSCPTGGDTIFSFSRLWGVLKAGKGGEEEWPTPEDSHNNTHHWIETDMLTVSEEERPVNLFAMVGEWLSGADVYRQKMQFLIRAAKRRWCAILVIWSVNLALTHRMLDNRMRVCHRFRSF
eukprot:GHVN01024381.1.p2 GENE.GHVN01024381.1~~GHVN01024381.1.p2  ORF type:complete len:235 (+),score=5.27 GHVN01024381.1:859-1563(+)